MTSQADILKQALAKLHLVDTLSNKVQIPVEVESPPAEHVGAASPAIRHVHFEREEGGEWAFKSIE